MRLVVSRFHNEAYLMGWWLRHHREMFDHGVLIDSSSTDETADICRSLVPGWEIVRTEYHEFSAIMADFEMMKQEARFPDAWKITLNTTEFLVAPSLAALEGFLEGKGHTGIVLPGAIMVDTEAENPPDPDLPLVDQKASGIWEEGFDFAKAAVPGLNGPTRSRVYHRFAIGAYAPGRHRSMLPGLARGRREQAAIWWYGYSPWTEEFKLRKQQFAATFGSFDKRFGLGLHHFSHLDDFDERWRRLSAVSRSLTVLSEQNAHLQAEIASLTGRIAERDATVERQADQLRMKEEETRRLQQRLDRSRERRTKSGRRKDRTRRNRKDRGR